MFYKVAEELFVPRHSCSVIGCWFVGLREGCIEAERVPLCVKLCMFEDCIKNKRGCCILLYSENSQILQSRAFNCKVTSGKGNFAFVFTAADSQNKFQENSISCCSNNKIVSTIELNLGKIENKDNNFSRCQSINTVLFTQPNNDKEEVLSYDRIYFHQCDTNEILATMYALEVNKIMFIGSFSQSSFILIRGEQNYDITMNDCCFNMTNGVLCKAGSLILNKCFVCSSVTVGSNVQNNLPKNVAFEAIQPSSVRGIMKEFYRIRSSFFERRQIKVYPVIACLVIIKH